MAITTLAQVISGLQPPMHFAKGNANVGSNHFPSFASSWTATGWPPTGTLSVSLAGFTCDNAVTGAMLPWNDPPGGTNAYLARFQMQATFAGGQGVAGFVLCDRLWQNGGINIAGAGAQTVNSIVFPARDINGSSDGDGVLLGIEVSVVTSTNVTPAVTASYTNQGGTAGRTATTVGTPNVASAATSLSSFILMALQAGDTGVRSVQSITIASGWSSGTLNIVAYRPIAYLDAETPNRTYAIDASTGVVHRLYNGSCLFVLVQGRVQSSQNMPLAGEVQVAWG